MRPLAPELVVAVAAMAAVAGCTSCERLSAQVPPDGDARADAAAAPTSGRVHDVPLVTVDTSALPLRASFVDEDHLLVAVRGDAHGAPRVAILGIDLRAGSSRLLTAASCISDWQAGSQVTLLLCDGGGVRRVSLDGAIQEGRAPISSGVLSPDGRISVTTRGVDRRVFDTATGRVLPVGGSAQGALFTTDVVWLRDSTCFFRALSASADQAALDQIEFDCPAGGTRRAEVVSSAPVLASVAAAPSRVVGACRDRAVFDWRLGEVDGGPEWTTAPAAVTAVSIRPSSDDIALGGADGRIRVGPFRSLADTPAGATLPASITALAWSPDGALVLATSADGSLALLPGGTEVGDRWQLGGQLRDPTFTAKGGLLAVVGSREVRVVRLADRRMITLVAVRATSETSSDGEYEVIAYDEAGFVAATDAAYGLVRGARGRQSDILKGFSGH